MLLQVDSEVRKKVKNDPKFRSRCIKETLRMYPAMPILQPHVAMCDHSIPNPIYSDKSKKKQKFGFIPFLRNILGFSPFEMKREIHIKKGTIAHVIPSVLHNDDRFWFLPQQFFPERWWNTSDVFEKPSLNDLMINTAKTIERFRSSQYPGLLVTYDNEDAFSTQEDALLFLNGRKTGNNRPIRSLILGERIANQLNEALKYLVFESTSESVFELQKWSFFSYGMGTHNCIGRPLNFCMVNSIIFCFFEFNVTFFKGFTPTLFSSRKVWCDRCLPMAMMSNFSSDDVYVAIKK